MIYKNEWFVENIKSCEAGLYSLAFVMLRNEEDAKDAVQETLYRAYDHISALKDPKKFKPWIMKILTNTAYEMLRKRKYTECIDEYIDILPDSTPIDASTKISLWESVQSLDINYRNIVVLYYYENLPIKEIAKILDITPEAVKKRLSRARMKLKQIL